MIRAIFDYFGWPKPSREKSLSMPEKRECLYENGQIRIREFYRDGKLEGEYKSWHEDGLLHEHKFYRDGKRDGEHKAWHPNGQIKERKFFLNGTLEGAHKSWYDNGTPWAERFYKDGKLNGEGKIRWKNAQHIFSFYFRDGEQVGTLTCSGIKNIVYIRRCFQKKHFQGINSFLISDLIRIIY